MEVTTLLEALGLPCLFHSSRDRLVVLTSPDGPFHLSFRPPGPACGSYGVFRRKVDRMSLSIAVMRMCKMASSDKHLPLLTP